MTVLSDMRDGHSTVPDIPGWGTKRNEASRTGAAFDTERRPLYNRLPKSRGFKTGKKILYQISPDFCDQRVPTLFEFLSTTDCYRDNPDDEYEPFPILLSGHIEDKQFAALAQFASVGEATLPSGFKVPKGDWKVVRTYLIKNFSQPE